LLLLKPNDLRKLHIVICLARFGIIAKLKLNFGTS